MVDIFLSYSRKDATKAGILAEKLESTGWSVWWDPYIQAGKSFREKILAELTQARCVIAIWSRTSIGSNWVLAEAEEGRRRKILLPVLTSGGVEPPLPFGEIQTVFLPWGHPQLEESPEYVKLLSDIEALIGKPAGQRPPPAAKVRRLRDSVKCERNCNTVPDKPDRRDREYQPSVFQVAQELDPPHDFVVLDSGLEGDATSFGLASVINIKKSMFAMNTKFCSSPAMINAKALEEDETEKPAQGSLSCRSALKAWHHWGICELKYWDQNCGFKQGWETNARQTPLAAYFRVREDSLFDMQAALNQSGVLYAAAWIHEGWLRPEQDNQIEPSDIILGGHAFAIVGYSLESFWILMPWGEDWGRNGLALLPYKDWIEHGFDVWITAPGLPAIL